MRAYWTGAAIKHLSAIYDYIAQDSPVYAKRMIDRLTQRSEQIASFPLSGRMMTEYEAEDIREIIERSYRIIYRIKPEQIDVLAVIHCGRLLPEDV